MNNRGELMVSFGIISVKILIFISSIFLVIYTISLFGYNIATPETMSKIYLIIMALWILLLCIGGLTGGKIDDKEKIFSE